MEPVRELAIVLRSIAFEERHRIVTAITEHYGLVSGMARNAIQSRRFGGSLEPFAAAEWIFVAKPGAELVRIDEAIIRRTFEGLRGDFEKLSIAGACSEILMKICPRMESCPELFRLHSNALALLEEMTPETLAQRALTLLNAYIAKILQWNGTQPRLMTCSGCEAQLEDQHDELSCIVASPGWICPACRQSRTEHIQVGDGLSYSMLRVSPNAIVDFQISLGVPIRKVLVGAQATREQSRDLFRFLEALLAFHVPGFDQQAIKSLRFLDVESNLRPAANYSPPPPPHRP